MQSTMYDETSRTTSIYCYNAKTLLKPIRAIQHGLFIHTSLTML
jgi:hypothetical protein